MRSPIIIIITAVLFPLFVTAQNYSLEEKVNSFIRNAVPTVGVEEVKVWKNATILDARKEHEYEVSHLPGAIYLGECPHHLEAVNGLNRNDTIIVYCTVGYRSENLGEVLMVNGYTNVFNLFGGIFAWKNAGGTVVDMNNKATEQVHTHNEVWSGFLKNGEGVY